MRVFGWKTLMRNESEGGLVPLRWEPVSVYSTAGAPSTGRLLAKDLSKSISVGTRKMVNYA